VAYTITVIPDLHPQIAVEEFKRQQRTCASPFSPAMLRTITAFQNLTFNYQIKKAKGGQLPMNTT
jgi:hypothetical protein